MGITFAGLERMERMGLLKPKCSVLDIGSSNLYSADKVQVGDFLDKYAPEMTDRDVIAKRLAEGSGYDPVLGGANGSFVGELFEKAGMSYLSIDIADGYNTLILDLNRASLPEHLLGKFDLVLNFGTTEHILNQFNCFEVIHDATRLGGYIHHSLPAVGYADHGYITYTGRCFFDIAGYNEYEIADFWFEGPAGKCNLFDSLRSYRTYFPALDKALAEIGKTSQASVIEGLGIPDISINVVYRKIKDKPFWGALESSTSVGNIPGQVTNQYAGNGAAVSRNVPEAPAGARHEQSSTSAPMGRTKSSIVRGASNALRGCPMLHGVVRGVYRAIKGGLQ